MFCNTLYKLEQRKVFYNTLYKLDQFSIVYFVALPSSYIKKLKILLH